MQVRNASLKRKLHDGIDIGVRISLFNLGLLRLVDVLKPCLLVPLKARLHLRELLLQGIHFRGLLGHGAPRRITQIVLETVCGARVRHRLALRLLDRERRLLQRLLAFAQLPFEMALVLRLLLGIACKLGLRHQRLTQFADRRVLAVWQGQFEIVRILRPIRNDFVPHTLSSSLRRPVMATVQHMNAIATQPRVIR